MDVHEFRRQWQGKYIENNGTLGRNMPIVNGRPQAQCVSVIGQGLQEHGIAQQRGSANDLDYRPIGGVWIPNSPANHPGPWDAVVFFGGDYDGTFGHIGFSLHGSDANHLHMLWQNDPDYFPVEAPWTGYANCRGWWRFPFSHVH